HPDAVAAIEPIRTRVVVVIVRNVGDVRNAGVADVDVAEIASATTAPPWVEWLSPTQRSPAPAPTTAPAETEPPADSPARTAKPGHHRRSVPRPHPVGARSPSPIAAGIHPAPIVKWRETPRRVIDPGPSPGINPHPVSVTIRRPIRSHGCRYPHPA